MSIIFVSFIRYLGEALGICARNIIPITLIYTCTLAVIVAFGAMIISLGSPLISEIGSVDFTIAFSSLTNMTLWGVAVAIPLFIMITLFYSVMSIYAFYISFKSEDENFRLFLSLLKENLWKVLKVSLAAFLRILIGTICFVIPGIVLALRYAAINYFVILENANFTTAREKSAEIMNGFKFYTMLFVASMSLLIEFLTIYTKNLSTNDHHELLHLAASMLYEGLFIMLYSTLVYVICKHATYKEIPVDSKTPPIIEELADTRPLA
jgi:hypothetical protein